MKKYYLALLILVCFFSTMDASPRSKVLLMGLGAAFAISAAQCFIAALGFTATGIAAGSWAAKLISIVTSFSGGSVPPGSFVTTLQSIDCLPTKACDIMPFMCDMDSSNLSASVHSLAGKPAYTLHILCCCSRTILFINNPKVQHLRQAE
ncbi:uncharacterized protein LOC144695908 isoform X1 [Cetorhinus maximus]